MYQFIPCDSKKKLKFQFTTRFFCCPACVRAKSLQLCSTLCDLWTVAHQAPLSLGFSRQEYWSELPCLSPGDLPDPGIKPVSLVPPALQAASLPLSHWGSLFCFPTGFYLQHPPVSKETICVCVCSVAPSCLILCDHKDCSQAGSSIHGIFQARILE